MPRIRAARTRNRKKTKKISPVTFFAPSWGSLGERIAMPQKYGDHKMVLQVRDPWGLHLYWELSPLLTKRRTDQLWKRGLSVQKWVLRLYEDPPEPAKVREEILLRDETIDNYYFQAEHDHAYFTEIGVVASDGAFYSMARSNRVKTPRFGMSGEIDERWKCTGEEYWKLFVLSGGFGVGSSAMEARGSFSYRAVPSP